MLENIIENYRNAKKTMNNVRFKQKYIFFPVYLVFNFCLFLTCLILLMVDVNPIICIVVLLGVSLLSSIGYIIYNRTVAKQEIEIEAKKLDEFFKADVLAKPDFEYVMPRVNETGLVHLTFSEEGIKIEDLTYSYDAFDCGLYTSNYCNKVNLIAVFTRTEKGDSEDGDSNGVSQFSIPFNLNFLSIMNKYNIKLKNPDVLRFIKDNLFVATKQILKYGKIQEDYDKLEKRQ